MTYWNHSGRYQEVSTLLEKFIPVEGPVVNAAQQPKLEKFRRASNVYYDYYTNGLGNRAREFKGAFGFVAGDYRICPGEYNERLERLMEDRMDKIVLEAAAEYLLNVFKKAEENCNGQ